MEKRKSYENEETRNTREQRRDFFQREKNINIGHLRFEEALEL